MMPTVGPIRLRLLHKVSFVSPSRRIRGQSMQSVRSADRLAFTYALILGVKFVPGLFPAWAGEAFTFTSVFKPGPFHSHQPAASMVTAMHDFFKWDQYVGAAAALVWGVVLELMLRPGQIGVKECGVLLWDVVRWSVIAGPGGALMQLLRRREEAVLSEQVHHESKES